MLNVHKTNSIFVEWLNINDLVAFLADQSKQLRDRRIMGLNELQDQIGYLHSF